MKIKGLCEVPEDERDTSIVAEVTPLGPLKSGGRVFTKLQRRTSPYLKKSSPSHLQQDQFNRNYYRIEQSSFAPINFDQENKSIDVNFMKYLSIKKKNYFLFFYTIFIVFFAAHSLYDCRNIN